MFMACDGLVFSSKNMQFHITEIDPHSDSLHNGIVKSKNTNFPKLFLTPVIYGAHWALDYGIAPVTYRAHIKFTVTRAH